MAKKLIKVSGHKRYDPRINKKVDVQQYNRNQKCNQYRNTSETKPKLTSKPENLIELKKKLNWQNSTEHRNSSFSSGLGIMSEDEKSMIVNTEEFKETYYYKDMVKHGLGKSNIDKPSPSGETYEIMGVKEATYNKKYIDQALSNLINPEIMVKYEDTPIAIIGKKYTMLIAPKIS